VLFAAFAVKSVPHRGIRVHPWLKIGASEMAGGR
jgi:hypothetical protein